MKALPLLLSVAFTPATATAQPPSAYPAALQTSETTQSPTRYEQSAADRSRAQQTRLSPSQQAVASAWGVTEEEYRRYLDLMQGVRGAVSNPRISPLEVLGIHAGSEAQRSDYARRFARVMHDDTDRVLAFERAYRQAWQDLYPSEPVIDAQRLQPRDRPRGAKQNASAYQLLYFLDTACTDCAALLTGLLRTVHKSPEARLDLFLTDLGPGDEAAVRRWATDQALDPALVRSGRVTLNLGRGVLDRLAPGAVAPQVYFRHDGRILPLDALSAIVGLRP